jgi:hypothetical protein
MSAIQILIQAVTVAASAFVFWQVEPVLNRMGSNCQFSTRVLVFLMATLSAGIAFFGAISLLSHPWVIFNTPACVCAVGFAALVHNERRFGSLLHISPNYHGIDRRRG